MKRSPLHWLLLLIAIAVGVLIGRWWIHSTESSEMVKIEDGSTIDFSSGKPVITDDSANRAVIEKAKDEMEEAAADVTFAPTKKADTSHQSAQP